MLVLASLYERGFGLPMHPFVWGLLFFFGLESNISTPNAVLHIACFITLCGAYLVMEPHWKPWKHIA